MKPSKLSLGSAAALGGILLIPASLAIANGDSACDDACVVELRELIDAQQRQLQQQAEMLNALQQRVESIATQSSVAVGGGVKDQPGVVKSGNDKVKLSISGQVNRGVLFTDDGKDTDVFFVDNDNSSTRIRFIGEAKPLDVLTIGTDIEVQFESNSTAAVNQENQSDVGPNNFTKRKLEFYLDNPIAGRVTVGYGDTASNSTSEVDLSGTTVIGFSEVEDLAGGILFRDKNGELSDTTIGNVFDNLDGLGRDDRIRYDSPSFAGVKFSTSAVADNRWDAAIRYGGDFGPVKTAAAIAGPRRSGFRRCVRRTDRRPRQILNRLFRENMMHYRYVVLIALLTLLLNACAQYQPMEVPQADAIPQGPGLFSGEEGEFVIYRR